MPKDKKTKEKKEGSSGNTVELVIKRKSSIVDPSESSSSSSSSSENSGNSSDNSQSGDSDGPVGSDNEKSTMTSDSVQGSCSNGCTVRIKDRTEEMRQIMKQNLINRPVRIVSDSNEVPITDQTHIVPISGDESQDGPSTSQKYTGNKEVSQATSNNKSNWKSVKNNSKQKQLTKKQKKELERKEKEGNNAPNYPGQKDKGLRIPLEYAFRQPEPNNLQVHQFDECCSNGIQDGNFTVQGANAAAQAMLGQGRVTIPFFRNEDDLGPVIKYTDLHKNSQIRYIRHVNTISKYTGTPAAVKLLHRMGFGVAASGIPDDGFLSLTINGAKPFMKYKFSEYIASGSKIHNWVSDFASTTGMDRASPDLDYELLMTKLKASIDMMISNATSNFEKQMIIALRDTNLRQLLLLFGEIERVIVRQEQARRNIGVGIYNNLPRFDTLSRPARLSYVVTQTLDWCTMEFLEKFEDDEVRTRACSMLMYLSSTCPGEKPCNEDKHRKCTMLYFMLHKAADREKHLMFKYTGGNTLLHFAAMSGAPCQIDILLRSGASLNELNDYFRSPLALALRRHSTLMARQLMWHGADIGGALSLSHIRPKNPLQTENKAISEYEDHCSKAIPYKAREFIIQRHRALNNSFVSWVEAILIDAEARVNLGIDSVKSSLHQIRIGRDIFDETVNVRGCTYIKKSFQIIVEQSPNTKEPVALFLLPCQYTKADTTMPANYPHIVRIGMMTDALAAAEKIAKKEKERIANGGVRVEYKQEITGCRPIKLLGESVSITFGDGYVNRRDILKPFFTFEHNGLLYGYNLPSYVSKTRESVVLTVNLTIPETEANRFKDAFFMVQAIQVNVREPPKPIHSAHDSHLTSDGKPKDPRAEIVAQEVAKRMAELISAEAERYRQKEERNERVLSMVCDIQTGVALKKRQKAAEEAAKAAARDSRSSSVSTDSVEALTSTRKTAIFKTESNSFEKPIAKLSSSNMHDFEDKRTFQHSPDKKKTD